MLVLLIMPTLWQDAEALLLGVRVSTWPGRIQPSEPSVLPGLFRDPETLLAECTESFECDFPREELEHLLPRDPVVLRVSQGICHANVLDPAPLGPGAI